MSTHPHKILSQVVQLSYDDASTAFRLQDRVSALQRNQLEGVMERVLNEFDTEGKIIRIQSLQIDLGSIEDADFEVLFPVMLEQALRDELGQMMIRKEYDPLVKVEALSFSEGVLEDWLYYLQHGIRKWHDNAPQPSLAEITKGLDERALDQLRERLIALLGTTAALERLLGHISFEELPAAMQLLFGEDRKEMERWMQHIAQQAQEQLGDKTPTDSVKMAIAQNLIKSWGRYGFQAHAKEQAKAKTLEKIQETLNVVIEAPLPEMDPTVGEGGTWKPVKILQYLLFYGYWPAAAPKQDAEVGLGEYIFQLLQSQHNQTVRVLQETLTYPTARKRLLYQLKQEQLQQVLGATYPEMRQAVQVWEAWLKTQNDEMKSLLKNPQVSREQWLAMLELEAESPARTTIERHQARLAHCVAAVLPEGVLASIVTKSDQETIDVEQEATAFAALVVQAYRERDSSKAAWSSKEDKSQRDQSDGPLKEDAPTSNDPSVPDTNKPKPIVPQSLLEDMPEEFRQQAKSPHEPLEQGNIDKEEDEAASQTSLSPKNQLEALLYFLKLGVWPETFSESTVEVSGLDGSPAKSNIVIPEAVLVQLLKDEPVTLLSSLFPMLVSARVRERLAYQLTEGAFQELLSAFATMHPPVSKLKSYFQKLQSLLAAWPMLSQSEAVASLPNFAPTLKTFMFTLLYEEPRIPNEWAFTVRFLTYWQQTSLLSMVDISEAVTSIISSQAVPVPVRELLQTAWAEVERGNKAASQTVSTQGTDDMLIASLMGEEGEREVMYDESNTLINESQEFGNKEFDDNFVEDKSDNPQSQTSAQKRIEPSVPNDLSQGSSQETENLPQTTDPNTEPAEKTRIEHSRGDIGNNQSVTPTSSIHRDLPFKDIETSENAPEDKKPLMEGAEEGTSKASPAPRTSKEDDNKTGDVLDNLKQEKPSVSRIEPTEQRPIEGLKANEPDKTVEDLPIDDAMADYPLPIAAGLPFNDAQTLMEQEAGEEIEPPKEQKTLRQKVEQINRQRIPEKVKQKRVLRPKDPFAREDPQLPLEEPVFIDNAGLVLLWPFIGRCFSALGYTEKGLFKDMASANRAIHLLQYMSTGEEQAPEHQLLLNKILCGIPVFEAVERDVILTAQERDETDHMLNAVVQNWEKMKKLSVPAFRDSFLKRSGRLTENDISWTLRVDQQSYDMLLDTLPWTIGMIKLRYMEKVLYVEWR